LETVVRFHSTAQWAFVDGRKENRFFSSTLFYSAWTGCVGVSPVPPVTKYLLLNKLKKNF
jgi:hypothetical protein